VRAIEQLEKERIKEEKERIKAEKMAKKTEGKHTGSGLIETQEGDKERKSRTETNNNKEEKSKKPSDSED